MNCGQIIAILEQKYPCELAESWDNSGFLVGRGDKEVARIYIALDATDMVIRQAKEVGADMLITHHPMLFTPIKQITTDNFIGSRIIELIQNDISYYAIHTNHDVVTMAPLASQMMKLKNEEILEVTSALDDEKKGFGRVGELPQEMSLKVCAEYVKEVFRLDNVKIFGDLEQTITRVAISPGSGKSMIQPAIQSGAEVLISGDFGHHEGIDAIMQGLAIIDAGHYGLEHIFISQMCLFMQEKFPELEVISEEIETPFQVI